MGIECRYSFDDLFRFANDREWTVEEKSAFMALGQADRNMEVKRLAKHAGCIATEDRIGTDGVTYTAFWVRESE